MAHKNAVISSKKTALKEIRAQHTAAALLRLCPFAHPKQTNKDVEVLLEENPDIISLPVVDDHKKPVGLINRNSFISEMAKPYGREIFGRKSCLTFMDKKPVVVAEHDGIHVLSRKMIDAGGRSLQDGFIITNDDGEYMGVGIGEDLMKAVSDIQAEKHRALSESISYASTIQTSFLRSSQEDMAASLRDYFIHWEPRDKVGGDYYFCKKYEDGFFIAIIDCTGHGVPGAFMTLIVSSFLDQILQDDYRHNPADALAAMNRSIKTALSQIEPVKSSARILNFNKNQSDDGMDAGFCWVNTKAGELLFAGAKTPLFYIEPGATEVTTIKGDNKGVGYVDTPLDYQWTNQRVPLVSGTCFYLTTDGIIDQIGGPKDISFGKKRFRKILLENVEKPMGQQNVLIMQEFYEYQGEQRTRDDVSLLGFRI